MCPYLHYSAGYLSCSAPLLRCFIFLHYTARIECVIKKNHCPFSSSSSSSSYRKRNNIKPTTRRNNKNVQRKQTKRHAKPVSLLARNDNIVVNEDSTITMNILKNDIVIKRGGAGKSLMEVIGQIKIIQKPKHGTLSKPKITKRIRNRLGKNVMDGGIYTYKPNSKYSGQDSFTYKLINNNGKVTAIGKGT